MAIPFLEIAIIVRRKGSSGKTWVSGEFLLRQQFSTKLVLTPSDPIGFDTMWIVGMKMMVMLINFGLTHSVKIGAYYKLSYHQQRKVGVKLFLPIALNFQTFSFLDSSAWFLISIVLFDSNKTIYCCKRKHSMRLPWW